MHGFGCCCNRQQKEGLKVQWQSQAGCFLRERLYRAVSHATGYIIQTQLMETLLAFREADQKSGKAADSAFLFENSFDIRIFFQNIIQRLDN